MSETNDTDTFGPYRLLDRLGQGGMGVVHVAEMVGEAGFRKRVAIKRMHRHYQGEKRLLELFATEARTNARIDHPNVVHVLEFGLEPEPFIVMEYVDGVSLRALLWRFQERRWAMDLRAAALIAAEAALGLDFAHRLTDPAGIPLGVVHRDISPSNVLISSEGSVKVSDFGLVMVKDNPFTADNNIAVGKPHYMAPEQAECLPLDARADVFALGLVLWESLTQRQLMPANNPQAIRQALATCSFHPPSRFNPYVPPELDWITLGCLQRNPQARWASAEALALALRQLLHTRGRGFDRIQLADLIRGAFPERGWGPKMPAQPPPQPTPSQLARLPFAPPTKGQEGAGVVEAPLQLEQTSPGSPQAVPLNVRAPADEEELEAERPEVFGLGLRGRRPDGGGGQYLVARFERSMWILRSSRPLQDGARLRGPGQGQLMIVVDGVGRRSVGEFGGVVAVDTLAQYVFSVMPWDVPRSEQDSQRLGRGLLAAARSCVAQLQTLSGAEGLGQLDAVSLVAVYALWPDLLVVQAGDSRCYAFRQGKLRLVAGAEPAGDAGATAPPPPEQLGQPLLDEGSSGGEANPVRLYQAELVEGDALLLATKGLISRVPEPQIEEGLGRLELGDSVEQCLRSLIGQARAAGGDELTAVLAKY